MPTMPTLPFVFIPFVASRADTVYTSPFVAPLMLKKSASMFPNAALVPVAVPPPRDLGLPD